MLVEFSVENHRAIGERQTLSMVPDCDGVGRREALRRAVETGHPAIPHLLPEACILGGFGSGKTSLFGAARVMIDVIRDSARFGAKSEIPVEPCALAPGWDGRPSEFEATFLCGGAAYRYGFAATRSRVEREWLAARTAESEDWSVLFERKWISEAKGHEATFAQGGRPDWLSKARPGALLLSAAAKAGAGGHLESAHAWLTGRLGTHDACWVPTGFRATFQRLRKAPWRGRVVEFFRHFGVRLSGIDVGQAPIADAFIPSDPSLSFRRILDIAADIPKPVMEETLRKKPNDAFFDIRLLRGRDDPGRVTLKAESSGVQAMFALAAPVLDALETGSVLFVDNLSVKLHPTAIEGLIEMFRGSRANPNGAQIVFTTSDPAIGREAFFERGQVWIMEMGQDGQASLGCERHVEGRRGVGRLVEEHLGGDGRRLIL